MADLPERGEIWLVRFDPSVGDGIEKSGGCAGRWLAGSFNIFDLQLSRIVFVNYLSINPID